jgi:crotonobetainyl-CoA:carnitine CoA-transferase CaiB-like acyl-CoA transferase
VRVTDWPNVGGTVAHKLSAAPALGEHTEAVLREAGVDEAIIRALL